MEIIKLTYQASSEHAGLRLDQAAAELFSGYSRARLQAWIREGKLTVDGQEVKPKHKLVGGEVLKLEAMPEPGWGVVAEDIPLDIIAADEHILVVNKPAGLVVHPAVGHRRGTLQNGLLFFDDSLSAVPRCGIVHRLDKDTSGVMVVARNLTAHASLVDQLQKRSMSRVYEAVVHGQTRSHGSIDAPIGRNPHDRQRMAVVEGGKPAISHYRLLNAFRHFSHVRVSLESGRTHQIRVHMKHLGFPLVGDPQYGRKTQSPAQLSEATFEVISTFPRQALHACRLRLSHPATGEACEFRAPLADDLVSLLTALEKADT
jgi:23S rRNA pseudouridine1911/1915/1917 synthase